jgi:hypothetical protein
MRIIDFFHSLNAKEPQKFIILIIYNTASLVFQFAIKILKARLFMLYYHRILNSLP